MRRRILRIGLGTLALLGVLVGGFAAWLHSAAARGRFEAIASQALDREVRVSSLELGWATLTLHDLTLSDPWAEGPALRVDRGAFEVEWSALLDGGLVGTLRAESFELDVRKRGQDTNLHGVRRPRSSGRSLDILLVFEGGDVRLHDEDRGETVSLEGVALRGRLERADARPALNLVAEAASIHGHGIEVRDVSVELDVDAAGVELSSLHAGLGQGQLRGTGRLEFDPASSWSAEVTAKGLGLCDELLPVVVAVFPGAAGIRSSPEGRTEGALSLRARVRAAGLTRASVLQSLDGRLSLRLDDVVLPRETAVVRIAALLGRPADPLRLDPIEVEASVRGPWVRVDAMYSDGQPLELPFDGRVAFDGRLDLEVDVLPIVRALPRAHAWARRYAAAVPIRLEGTADDPIIRPPSAGAMARAMTTAWVERALD